MKMLFVTIDPFKSYFFHYGAGAIIGYLKENGIECDAVPFFKEKEDFDNIINKIKEFKPDLIGFSAAFIQSLNEIRKLGKHIKQNFPDIPINIGGYYTLYNCVELIKEDWIDIITRGDGELPTKMILENLKTKNFQNIPNIIYKDKTWHFNKLEYMVPTPTLESYDEQWFMLEKPLFFPYMFTRGCYFNCTYCGHSSVYETFKNTIPTCNKKSDYYRKKDIHQGFNHFKENFEKFPKEYVCIHDDLIAMENDWFFTFTDLYKDKINVPYYITSQTTLLTDKVGEHLAESNCSLIRIGLESGNFNIRKDILRRVYNEDMIKRCFDVCNKWNLNLKTTNLIGIPGETLENMHETLKINAKYKPRTFNVYVVFPFKGTQLHDMCVKNNWINKKVFNDKSIMHNVRFNGVIINQKWTPKELFALKQLAPWYTNTYLNDDSFLYTHYTNLINKWKPRIDKIYENTSKWDQLEKDLFEEEQELLEIMKQKQIEFYYGELNRSRIHLLNSDNDYQIYDVIY